MSAIFELDQISKLPLYAQAFIASRMARRAVLFLPASFPDEDRTAMIRICDTLDNLCRDGGASMKNVQPLYDRADRFRSGAAGEAAEAVYWAVDAAASAEAANDFPVDATWIRDTEAAMAAASRSHGLSPLQVRLYAASDLDSLRFSCGEAHVRFYDALGSYVMERIAPVYAPDER
jgi:hypothetical protein